jgi:very-short-patch-repair endonuclease
MTSNIIKVLDQGIKFLEPGLRATLIEKYKLDSSSYDSLRKKVRAELCIDKLPNGTATTSVKFFQARGWADQALSQVKKFNERRSYENSPYCLKSWLDKGLSLEQAELEIKKRRSFNIEHWKAKGLTDEQARLQVTHLQKAQSVKGNSNHYKGRSPVNVEYWLTRKNPITAQLYTLEEAIAKVSERQDTISYKRQVKIYGYPKGIYVKIKKLKTENIRYDYILALSGANNLKEFESNLDKLRSLKKGHASIESLKLFRPLYLMIKDITDVYIGAFGLKEFKIYKDNKFVRYDFTIPKFKLIFEYDGEYYHDSTSLQKDQQKTMLAEEIGYKLIRLSSKTSFNENVAVIKNNIAPYFANLVLPTKFGAFSKAWKHG